MVRLCIFCVNFQSLRMAIITNVHKHMLSKDTAFTNWRKGCGDLRMKSEEVEALYRVQAVSRQCKAERLNALK